MAADPAMKIRLREARLALGYTQKDMGKATGSTLRTWQEYEGARRSPGSKVIAGMARIGFNANWVLIGEGPMLMKDLNAVADGAAEYQAHPKIQAKEVLRTVIESIETALAAADRQLPPAIKAELILLVYEWELERSQREGQLQVDTERIARLVQVVGN